MIYQINRHSNFSNNNPNHPKILIECIKIKIIFNKVACKDKTPKDKIFNKNKIISKITWEITITIIQIKWWIWGISNKIKIKVQQKIILKIKNLMKMINKEKNNTKKSHVNFSIVIRVVNMEIHVHLYMMHNIKECRHQIWENMFVQ